MMYRIRMLDTGLFSKGGIRPRFSKVGKVWTSSGALTNHLVQFADKYLEKQDSHWQIEEFDFDAGTVKTVWSPLSYLASRPSRQKNKA